MTPDRHDTLFNLRYAVRVLERHARLWRRIDLIVRVAGLFAGTAAFGALTAENRTLSLMLGVVFAIFQAVEYVMGPGGVAEQSLAQRKQYALVLSRSRTMADADLAVAYDEIVAEDDIIVPEALRRVAYNDVVIERGLDSGELIELSPLNRMVSFFA